MHVQCLAVRFISIFAFVFVAKYCQFERNKWRRRWKMTYFDRPTCWFPAQVEFWLINAQTFLIISLYLLCCAFIFLKRKLTLLRCYVFHCIALYTWPSDSKNKVIFNAHVLRFIGLRFVFLFLCWCFLTRHKYIKPCCRKKTARCVMAVWALRPSWAVDFGTSRKRPCNNTGTAL